MGCIKGQKELVHANVKQRAPKTEAERIFCDHWLRSRDHLQAAQAAGINKYKTGLQWRRRFAAYLSKKVERVEVETAKAIAYDQQDLLNEMAAVAFANAQDYLIKVQVMVRGKLVERDALKPIDMLTRHQAAAIKHVKIRDGKAVYQLPDLNEKYQFLFALGKNLGLYHDKLIHEFRHQHLHAHVDFKDLPMDKLDQLEKLLVDALGQDALRLLGVKNVNEDDEHAAEVRVD